MYGEDVGVECSIYMGKMLFYLFVFDVKVIYNNFYFLMDICFFFIKLIKVVFLIFMGWFCWLYNVSIKWKKLFFCRLFGGCFLKCVFLNFMLLSKSYSF